jgi:uncharacterized protein YqgV (UPF0045/DUF77 family)
MAVQVSVYPLRQTSISDAISKALVAFRASSVDVHPGAMSTVIIGSEDAVFTALREGYCAAAAQGEMVMIATLSNACPVPEAPDGEGAADATRE